MPPRPGRRPRTGRWEDPASPLQAARYERRWDQWEVCRRVRAICSGHRDGVPCRLEPPKLSDWERGRRPPCMKHVIALSQVYGKPAEALGLLRWDGMAVIGDQLAGAAGAYATNNPGRTERTTAGYAPPDEASRLSEGGDQDGPANDPMLVALLGALLGEGGSDQMRRDRFVKGMGAAAGAAVLDPFMLLGRQAQAAIYHTKVGSEQIQRLTGATDRHARDYYQLTEEGRLRSLMSDWAGTQRLLKLPATLSQQRELLNIYARLSGILGQFALGRRHHDRARALLETGLDAARESGDTELVGWHYAKLSDAANRSNRFRDVVELAGSGLEAVGSGGTVTAAYLHGWLARGYAGMGDDRATRTHLETAARILGNNPAAGRWPAALGARGGFTHPDGAFQRTTAMAHLRLGNYAAVIDNCEQAHTIFRDLGMSPRTATPVTGNMMTRAEAMLRTGELEGATEVATVAVRAYEGVALPTRLRQARRFERELAAAAPGSRYAAEFGELVRARAATGSGRD